ncbi:MAG: CapA family protein, partial [Clostridia bacterium]|nr:CapA family protein [Clostridia bacterium]
MKKGFHKKFIYLYSAVLVLLILALINLFVYKGMLGKHALIGHPGAADSVPTGSMAPSASSATLPSAANSPTPSESASPSNSSSPSASASPPTTPTPAPTPLTATLVSAGDCVLHKAFQESAHVKGQDKYDFSQVFEALKPFTGPADLSLISFESAATNSRKDYTGYPMFNCPPEIFNAFKGVGFDIVNNSNNHQLDRKVKGMLETRQNIRKAGLEVIGAYDGEEPRYRIKDLNGIKVGIMAYTYSCNMNEKALTAEQQARYIA